jgi:ribosomal-protein-alanine N-acetyltransferase
LWSFETAQESDISEILEIENISFSHPWKAGSFLEELACSESRNYVLRNEIVIAYICFRMLFGEMHIFKIAVRHEWRHNGIASLILEKSIKLALKEGAETAFLEVRQSNIPALALYRKFGFEIIGKRPGYYPETGEDGLVLMKSLK